MYNLHICCLTEFYQQGTILIDQNIKGSVTLDIIVKDIKKYITKDIITKEDN